MCLASGSRSPDVCVPGWAVPQHVVKGRSCLYHTCMHSCSCRSAKRALHASRLRCGHLQMCWWGCCAHLAKQGVQGILELHCDTFQRLLGALAAEQLQRERLVLAVYLAGSELCGQTAESSEHGRKRCEGCEMARAGEERRTMNSKWLAIWPEAPVTAIFNVFFQLLVSEGSSCDDRHRVVKRSSPVRNHVGSWKRCIPAHV